MAKKITDEMVAEIAEYFVQKRSTVRETGSYFGVSKSSVYSVLKKRVKDASLRKAIDEMLAFNRIIGRIRSGQSTKMKYMVERAKKLSKT